MNVNGNRGVGVVGIIDCYFLTPTHNKQDFVYGDRYRVLLETLKENVRQYWVSCNIDASGGGEGIRRFWGTLNQVKDSGPFWIQCDNCLAWRHVRKSPDAYPLTWICQDNTDKKYNSCRVPEVLDSGFPPVKITKKGGKSKRKEEKNNKRLKESQVGEHKEEGLAKEPEKDFKVKPPDSLVPEDKVDVVILDHSIDDSLLSIPDAAKRTKKENGKETMKRKAKDTPQSAPLTKKARRIESPEETPTRNNEPSDPDPPEKNLAKKLSLVCMQLAKQFSTSSDVEFDNFETSAWLSFDIENFITQVIKNSKEQITDTKLEASKVAPNNETAILAPNFNFFAFL